MADDCDTTLSCRLVEGARPAPAAIALSVDGGTAAPRLLTAEETWAADAAEAMARMEIMIPPAPASDRTAAAATADTPEPSLAPTPAPAAAPATSCSSRRWPAPEASVTELSDTSDASRPRAAASDDCAISVKLEPAASTAEKGTPDICRLALTMTGAKLGLHSSDEFAPATGVPEPAGHGRQSCAERAAVLKVLKGQSCSGAPAAQ